jgi:hypothetical protein
MMERVLAAHQRRPVVARSSWDIGRSAQPYA